MMSERKRVKERRLKIEMKIEDWKGMSTVNHVTCDRADRDGIKQN